MSGNIIIVRGKQTTLNRAFTQPNDCHQFGKVPNIALIFSQSKMRHSKKNYAGNFSDGQPKKLQVFDLCSSFLKRKIAFSRHRDRMKYPDAIPRNLDKESYKRPTEIPSSGLRFLSKDYLFKNSFDLFIQQTFYERIDIETAPAFYSFCKMNCFYQCK